MRRGVRGALGVEEKKWVMEGEVGWGWTWPPWEVKSEMRAGVDGGRHPGVNGREEGGR